MQVAPQYQQDPAALSMLYVQARGGKLVPLSAVVDDAADRRPAVGQPHRPAAVGDAVVQPEAGRRARRCRRARRGPGADRRCPGTVTGSFQGTAQAFQESMRGLGWVLALAIFVIYVVLGILYESFIHPLTILSGLPSAGFGALLTLLLFKQDLNIYAFVGIIMLVGLVKKNGIMMIDFAIEARRERALERRRRDLRSLSGPLPADHDDDDGGADGHAADRAGLGRGRRSPASARPRGRRRPAGLADADALRHAGLLHLHGDTCRSGCAAAARCASPNSRNSPRRCSRISSRSARPSASPETDRETSAHRRQPSAFRTARERTS